MSVTVLGDQAVTAAFVVSAPPGCIASPAEFAITGTGDHTLTVNDVAQVTATECEYTVLPAPITGYNVTTTNQTGTSGDTLSFVLVELPQPGEIVIVKTVVGDQSITSVFDIETPTGCSAPATAEIVGTGRVEVLVTTVAELTASTCGYTITERPIDGYQVLPPGGSVTAQAGELVEFTNTLIQPVGELVVTVEAPGGFPPATAVTVESTPGCTIVEPFTVSDAIPVIEVVEISFPDGQPCTYTVSIEPPEGYQADSPTTVVIAGSGQADFAISPIPTRPGLNIIYLESPAPDPEPDPGDNGDGDEVEGIQETAPPLATTGTNIGRLIQAAFASLGLGFFAIGTQRRHSRN